MHLVRERCTVESLSPAPVTSWAALDSHGKNPISNYYCIKYITDYKHVLRLVKVITMGFIRSGILEPVSSGKPITVRLQYVCLKVLFFSLYINVYSLQSIKTSILKTFLLRFDIFPANR